MILKHILYKYISICPVDSILAIFKQNAVLFRDLTDEQSLAACSPVNRTTGNIHDSQKFSETLRNTYKLYQKVDKIWIKLNKTHGEHSRPNKPRIKYFPIHLNPSLTITPALWQHEIFPKCSVVPTLLWYICIQLVNQTSDFYEIFSVNSENVILCGYDLILNRWGHFLGF